MKAKGKQFNSERTLIERWGTKLRPIGKPHSIHSLKYLSIDMRSKKGKSTKVCFGDNFSLGSPHAELNKRFKRRNINKLSSVGSSRVIEEFTSSMNINNIKDFKIV